MGTGLSSYRLVSFYQQSKTPRTSLCHPRVVMGTGLGSCRSVGFCYQQYEIASNPDFDPLENVLNRPIGSSQESMTPTLESRKDFTVVVNNRTQADGTGILRNEARAIEFSSSMSPKVNINT
jgi:hypothetical protein